MRLPQPHQPRRDGTGGDVGAAGISVRRDDAQGQHEGAAGLTILRVGARGENLRVVAGIVAHGLGGRVGVQLLLGAELEEIQGFVQLETAGGFRGVRHGGKGDLRRRVDDHRHLVHHFAGGRRGVDARPGALGQVERRQILLLDEEGHQPAQLPVEQRGVGGEMIGNMEPVHVARAIPVQPEAVGLLAVAPHVERPHAGSVDHPVGQRGRIQTGVPGNGGKGKGGGLGLQPLVAIGQLQRRNPAIGGEAACEVPLEIGASIARVAPRGPGDQSQAQHAEFGLPSPTVPPAEPQTLPAFAVRGQGPGSGDRFAPGRGRGAVVHATRQDAAGQQNVQQGSHAVPFARCGGHALEPNMTMPAGLPECSRPVRVWFSGQNAMLPPTWIPVRSRFTWRNNGSPPSG